MVTKTYEDFAEDLIEQRPQTTGRILYSLMTSTVPENLAIAIEPIRWGRKVTSNFPLALRDVRS